MLTSDPHDVEVPSLSDSQQAWCEDLDLGVELLDNFLKWLDSTTVLEASTIVDEQRLSRWRAALEDLEVPSENEFIE
jgi:hypothetical protein